MCAYGQKRTDKEIIWKSNEELEKADHAFERQKNHWHRNGLSEYCP